MHEQLPRWCQILDEWLIIAERELKKSEKKGTAATAPNKTTQLPHPVKKRGDYLND